MEDITYTFTDPKPSKKTASGEMLADLVIELFDAEQKISAIKVVFDATGAGLKASKRCVDAAMDLKAEAGYNTARLFLEGALIGLRSQAMWPGVRAKTRNEDVEL